MTNLNQHDPLHDLMNTPVEQEPEETHKGLLFLSHKYCYVKDCPEPWIDFDWYRDYQPADKRDDGQKFWPRINDIATSCTLTELLAVKF